MRVVKKFYEINREAAVIPHPNSKALQKLMARWNVFVTNRAPNFLYN